MRATFLLLAMLLPAACGGGARTDTANNGRDSLRIVVVSHGQSSDPFWSVVANGVNDAGRDLGVRVEYQAPTSFDMVRMSELISAAVAAGPAGLIVSVPDATALKGAIESAQAAGIPVLSINSGAEAWKQLNLLAHIGQTEYESAFAAGERLAGAGARKVLCVNHELGNVSLDERCRGLADALKQKGGSAVVLGVRMADPDDAQQRISGAITADASIDGVLTLGPGSAVPAHAALTALGRLGEIPFGTFDLDTRVLESIRDGRMLFAIDQQPYLQGYLGVVLMTKYLEAGTMPGGGEIVRTGPSFVTLDNAVQVMRLTEQGIR